MNTYRIVGKMFVPAVVIWVVTFLLLGVPTIGQGEVTDEAGVQILTRGPIHEAFAEVYISEAAAGIRISKRPYDPIEELPPDQRPEGANVAWIPGYWNWDGERNDFIWVSGVWREIPPGRQWVPGYWASVESGWQWISGFWGEVAQNNVTYLPAPPEPLEVGPSSPAPAPDHIWSPGCWYWMQTRYVWQPGYWVIPQPEWVWVPAHYTWTPCGHVYVAGYWDHAIAHRGVIFAPVYYEQPVYLRPSYYYSPSIVINIGLISACLFIQPISRHYYFGDYYDRRYEEIGFYPWYSSRVSRYGYDPLYAHYRSVQLRLDADWDVHLETRYRYFRENVEARPPQTFALQVNIFNSQKIDVSERIFIGQSLSDVVRSKTSSLRFASVNMGERTQIKSRGKEVQKLQFERAKLETNLKTIGKSKEARDTAKSFSMRLPESPVAARNMKGERTPPHAPDAPKLQTKEIKGSERKTEKVESRKDSTRPEEKKSEKAETRKDSTKPDKKPEKVESRKDSPKPNKKPEANNPKSEPKVQERSVDKKKQKEENGQTPSHGESSKSKKR